MSRAVRSLDWLLPGAGPPLPDTVPTTPAHTKPSGSFMGCYPALHGLLPGAGFHRCPDGTANGPAAVLNRDPRRLALKCRRAGRVSWAVW
jgi:hypothetical protein